MRQHRRRGPGAASAVPAMSRSEAQAHCGEAGKVMPLIDRERCEGKNDCVRVCPYDVFEVRRIDAPDFSALSFKGKVRSLLHGRMTAYTPAADACHACGLCVTACPEDAIRLVKNPSKAA